MSLLRMILAGLAILPLGLGSIHVTEILRWHESRRGLWKVAIASDATFAIACILLLFQRNHYFSLTSYIRILLEMMFITYFLVALVYLLHSVAWVISRIGKRVYFDELFSRLFSLAVFAVLASAAFTALAVFYGGI